VTASSAVAAATRCNLPGKPAPRVRFRPKADIKFSGTTYAAGAVVKKNYEIVTRGKDND